MPSLLAIVSKAQFEGLSKSARPGDRLRLDRYDSTHKALAPLSEGGALFLVTVRPPDEALWLVAILESPRLEGGAWRAAPSEAPITDVTALREKLRFSTGSGIQAKKGALGMSLQTPRRLTDADVLLLRSAVGRPAGKASVDAPPVAPEKKAGPRKAEKRTKPAKPARPPETAPELAKPLPPLPPPEPYTPEVVRTLTGEAARLWKRVVDEPDDLKTRSVLADLLQEQGDPLGEFLQLSCMLEEMAPDDARRPGLRERAEALRRRHVVLWTREVAAVAGLRPQKQPYRKAFRIERGLVEALICTTRALPALAAAARVAPIRALEVDPFGESVKAAGWAESLSAMPELSRIRDLTLKVEAEAEALAVLRSPNLSRLERLAITGLPSASEVIAEIARGKACQGLVELEIASGSPARAPSPVETLAALPLQRLSLSRVGVGPEAAQALARMKTLRSLSLRDEPLGLSGARALAASPDLASLEELSLGSCEVPEKGLAALAGSTSLESLERLGLSNVNAKALAAMLQAWQLGRVRELTLLGALRAEGARLLAGSKVLPRLESLSLRAASLRDEGVAELARGEAPALRRVDLGGNGLGPEGLEALSEGALLSGVRELDLANNKCGGEGGKALAKGPWLAHLRKLHLYYNWMGVHGLRAILGAMPEAEELDLGENNYGSEVFRVAASGALPRLHTLKLGQEGDPELLAEWLDSGHAMRLRSLGVHHVHVSARMAQALAPVPELEDLYFSFCTFEPEALSALEQRFPGLTRFWPYHD